MTPRNDAAPVLAGATLRSTFYRPPTNRDSNMFFAPTAGSPSPIFRFPLRLCVGLAVLAVLLSAGCDGGNGSGGGGTPPTTPQPFVNVVSDGGDPPSVSMARAGSTQGANLLLEILATDLENAQTVDFILVYPGNLLRATTVTPGDFLGAGATIITTALDGSRLQVLMTRTDGLGSTGNGLIASVQFEATAAGTGRLTFGDPEAVSPNGLVIQGINWIGADVEVSP